MLTLYEKVAIEFNKRDSVFNTIEQQFRAAWIRSFEIDMLIDGGVDLDGSEAHQFFSMLEISNWIKAGRTKELTGKAPVAPDALASAFTFPHIGQSND